MSFIVEAESLFDAVQIRSPKAKMGASYVLARKLSYQARKHIADHEFVFPKHRKYPIQDIEHARDALSRASGSHNPAVKSKVFREVYRRYPQLRKRGSAMMRYLGKHANYSRRHRRQKL